MYVGKFKRVEFDLGHDPIRFKLVFKVTDPFTGIGREVKKSHPSFRGTVLQGTVSPEGGESLSKRRWNVVIKVTDVCFDCGAMRVALTDCCGQGICRALFLQYQCSACGFITCPQCAQIKGRTGEVICQCGAQF